MAGGGLVALGGPPGVWPRGDGHVPPVCDRLLVAAPQGVPGPVAADKDRSAVFWLSWKASYCGHMVRRAM